MKPAPFRYLRATSLQQALETLAGEPGAKVLAGGQSLVPLLSMRLAAPTMLVDLNGVPDLDQVRCDDQGVHVGALARHADVLASPEARATQPLLGKALGHVAHATIRNRGTTVGSLVHADAAAEMPTVLAVLEGYVDVVSVRGSRRISAADLVVGPLESSLAHDEIAVEATFPAAGPGEGCGFAELARRHGDYAMCGVAVTVRRTGSGLAARAGILAVADVPTVVDLSPALAGGGATEDALSGAGELALAAVEPEADLHATAAYRAQLVRVLTARALREAYAELKVTEAVS